MTRPGIRVNVSMILPKLIGGVLAAALLLAPAARADVLDPVDGFHIAALDGTRLWNHKDDDEHFTLVNDGGDALLRQRSESARFDVSLGTDTEGRVLAVYSRCIAGATCNLYAYDVETGSERPLGIRGVAPSLSDGVLAYAHGRNVYLGRLGTTPRKIAHIDGRLIAVDAVANSARGVAFMTEDPIRGMAVYFKPAGGGKLRRIARSPWGVDGGGTHASPVWHGGLLYWAFSNQDEEADPNGWVIRYSISSHRAAAAPVTPGYVDAIAFDGPTLITSAMATTDDDGQGQ